MCACHLIVQELTEALSKKGCPRLMMSPLIRYARRDQAQVAHCVDSNEGSATDNKAAAECWRQKYRMDNGPERYQR